MTRTPLHAAAIRGDVAAIRGILAESPGDALTADDRGDLPLKCAACRGDTAVAELLVAAAPDAAPVADPYGRLPPHAAAWRGRAAAVELLLAAAPETERAKANYGKTAFFYAARYGHLPVARLLLERSAAAPAQLIADLLAAARDAYGPANEEERQQLVHTLLADLAAHRALSPADWARFPTPTPGLARALPAVLARSPAEAAQLVAHLPAAARGRLRALALSLGLAQRRLGLELPECIEWRILAAAPIEE
eukprot:scaffold23.g4086.t1